MTEYFYPQDRAQLVWDLLNQKSVCVGEWHAQHGDQMRFREMLDVTIRTSVPKSPSALVSLLDRANHDWAEEHFQERVSTYPLNPPPSHERWPFGNTSTHMNGDQFSHTYPERFWPKFANEGMRRPNGRQVFVPHNGIRFEYGDLFDLIRVLRNNGNTRQAYLPIWFPEDLQAARQGERVPCSLGYHFQIRSGRLRCHYALRSCEFKRHFDDDLYMAARLMQWVCANVPGVEPGLLTTDIYNLHVLEADCPLLETEALSALTS